MARGALLRIYSCASRQHCSALSASLAIIGCAYGGSIARRRALRSLSLAALTATALHGTFAQHCAARGASLDVIGCAYDGSMARHVVPRSISLAALVATALLGTWCLARGHCLRLRRQHWLARGVLLDINNCAYRGSATWHVVPRSVSLTALWWQHCTTRGASLVIIGCAYGGSIAWHVVPCSISSRYHWLRFSGSIVRHVAPRSLSLAALTAAALLGT